MITILNTSILTNFGAYNYHSISLLDAQQIVENNPFQSAIGHQATADILTSLLGVTVPMNRIQYSQQQGDTALVFKLKGRAEEGKILTVAEIEEMGYEFGLLKRLM